MASDASERGAKSKARGFKIEIGDVVFLRGLGGKGLITGSVVIVKVLPDLDQSKQVTCEYKAKVLNATDKIFRGPNTLVCFTDEVVLDVLKRDGERPL